MLETAKLFVRRHPTLYCFMAILYAHFVGRRSARECGASALIRQSGISADQTIIFYCYFPSHYQNIKRIPSLLKRQYPSFNVWLLCNFTSDEYSPQEDQDVVVQHSISYFSCRLFSARLFITPMVGISRCSFPKGSVGIHFLVSLAGIEGVYLDYQFDGWDYIFCASEEQIVDFKQLSTRRNLDGIRLLRGGYPKLDDQIEAASRMEFVREANTVIYAPTHVYEGNSNLASLIDYGESIVDELLGAGIATIFRPHPASFLHPDDKRVIDRICARHSSNPLFSLDNTNDYTKTYARASLMVTDLSGTGFTYALTFARPVIFFSSNIDAESKIDGLHIRDRTKIGYVARNVAQICQQINDAWSDNANIVKSISRYRMDTIFNIGRSRDYFMKRVSEIINNRQVTDVEQL